MVNVAINGLGRMGKLVLRALIEDGIDARLVLLNDAKGNPAQHAHLLEFDTVHGRWPAAFAYDAESVSINGARIALTTAAKIEDLPLKA
jgi:glyceraldehyde 3-phosphate dehydrogenase